MSFKKVLIIFIFLILCTSVFAQNRDIRILYLFEENKRTDFSDNEYSVLYETLLVKLNNDIENIQMVENQLEDFPDSEDEKSSLAVSLNTDAWLNINIDGDSEDMTVKLQLYSLNTSSIIMEEKLENKSFSSFRELGRQFWNDVVELVNPYLKEISQINVNAQNNQSIDMQNIHQGKIIISAAPGTIITGLGEEKLIVGDTGELEFRTNIPAVYQINASLSGYLTEKKEIFVTEEVETVNLEQRRVRRFFLDFYLNNLSFFGTDLNVFIIPDRFFAKVGFTTLIGGIHFTQNDDESIFVSYPLTYLYGGVGVYINKSYHIVRASISAVFFTRIVHSIETGFGIDKQFPFGIQPILSAEFLADRRLGAFIEYAPYMYFTKYESLAGAAYPRDYNFNTHAVFGKMLIEFFNFRVGMRFRL